MNKPALSNNQSGQILPLVAISMGLLALGIFSLGQLGGRAVNIAKAESTAEIIGHAVQMSASTELMAELSPESVSKLIKTAQQIAQANSSELINLQNSADNQSIIVEIEHKGHRVSVIVGK